MSASIEIAQGYQFGSLHCGIKKESGKRDLTLIASDRPATAAGVYTQNLVCAAPVLLDRERTPGGSLRAIVVNSGVANACTGDRGMDDARKMGDLTGQALGVEGEQVLVMSTGIIGEFLPMDEIAGGVVKLAPMLQSTEEATIDAATGMMTTDTVHKLASRKIEIDGHTIRLTGMAKGAAMIGPNMATMLGLVVTDAALAPEDAQRLLLAAVEDTFNCISVDGHTSTNDTVLLMANGAAGGSTLEGESLDLFAVALQEICEELAKSIPSDGEGATHLITVDVSGCANKASARKIAKTIADSPLVKTAVTGADPNWGRIVSAAGYAGVPFATDRVTLYVNGFLLYENGVPVAFDEGPVSVSIRDKRDTAIDIRFGDGDATAKFWTTDLTAEYVRLNADYRT